MDNEGLQNLADAIRYAADVQAETQRVRLQYHFIEVSSGPYNKFKFSGRVPVVLLADGLPAADVDQQAALREGMDALLDFAERYALQNGYASNPPVWREADGNLDDQPQVVASEPSVDVEDAQPSRLPAPPAVQAPAPVASQDPDAPAAKHVCHKHNAALEERISKKTDNPYWSHIDDRDNMCFGVMDCERHGAEMSYNSRYKSYGHKRPNTDPASEKEFEWCNNGEGWPSEKE